MHAAHDTAFAPECTYALANITVVLDDLWRSISSFHADEALEAFMKFGLELDSAREGTLLPGAKAPDALANILALSVLGPFAQDREWLAIQRHDWPSRASVDA
jgi:hypothetical protein